MGSGTFRHNRVGGAHPTWGFPRVALSLAFNTNAEIMFLCITHTCSILRVKKINSHLFFLHADFFYTYFLKTRASAVFMSVDPRQCFSSGPIVTSQLCVAEKLIKKSKTNDRPH